METNNKETENDMLEPQQTALPASTSMDDLPINKVINPPEGYTKPKTTSHMFENAMRNREHYFSSDQIRQIIGYWWDKDTREGYETALLFLTLYRTGRRISELLGKPPFNFGARATQSLGNYKGLRPCDILQKDQLIEFEILKKNPVKRFNKQGRLKPAETVAALQAQKSPVKKPKAVDKELFDLLNWYISTFEVKSEERIFRLSRFSARLRLIEAVKALGIQMNLGRKIVRNKASKRLVEVVVEPHLHMFRHSFAVHVLERNEKDPSALIKVSDLLDHSRLEITRSYLRFNQKSSIDFMDKTWEVTK